MTPLSDIEQVRFIEEGGMYGAMMLVVNRPGVTDLTLADPTKVLWLVRDTDPNHPDRYSPYNTSDYQLSKKLASLNGRRAMDDITLTFRDSLGYSGTVDDGAGHQVFQSESFRGSYNTFFGEWFSDVTDPYTVVPYKAWILYKAAPTPALPSPPIDMVGGWIDPTYAPITDAECYEPGTANQILLGTRTIKITALSRAQQSLTWGSVLSAYDATANPNVPVAYTGIGAGDCQEGVPYNGFVLAPDGYHGSPVTNRTPFDSGGGVWMLAVPFVGGQTHGTDLWGLPPAVWPTKPFSVLPGAADAIGVVRPHTFGTGYAVGDTGTIAGGSTLATYKVTSVHSAVGVILYIQIQLTFAGAGYSLGTNIATTATSGGGNGMTVDIVRLDPNSVWGPPGYVFIKIKTLLEKISVATGLNAFTGLVSALDFFLQKHGANFSFPITATALSLSELYVSLNVFACSHPYDGSLWNNSAGWNPDTPVSDVVTGLCNFLAVNFNEQFLTDGSSSLVLSKMGTLANSLPAPFATGEWQPILAAPDQQEPNVGPRMVNVQNRGDSLIVQCPYGLKGTTSNIEIPIRLHRLGLTGTSANGAASVDKACITWDDAKTAQEQADECFLVVWLDANENPAINPNCWKGLAGLFWFDSAGTAAVYPSNWNPFPRSDGGAASWANSFHAVNACFKSGGTPATDLQGQPKGSDYFNSRCYHSVAFAALTLPLPFVQTFNYNGVSDASGNIQPIAASMSGQWRYLTNGTQAWSAQEVSQLLKAGTSQIKWQAVSGANHFPEINALHYAAITGGTSSSGGGGSSTGGVSGGTTPSAWNIINPAALTTDTNNLAIGQVGYTRAFISSTSDVNLTGITNGANTNALILVNNGSNYITLTHEDTNSSAANRFHFPGANPKGLGPDGTIYLYYDTTLARWRADVVGS